MWQFLPLILTCLVSHNYTWFCDFYESLLNPSNWYVVVVVVFTITLLVSVVYDNTHNHNDVHTK